MFFVLTLSCKTLCMLITFQYLSGERKTDFQCTKWEKLRLGDIAVNYLENITERQATIAISTVLVPHPTMSRVWGGSGLQSLLRPLEQDSSWDRSDVRVCVCVAEKEGEMKLELEAKNCRLSFKGKSRQTAGLSHFPLEFLWGMWVPTSVLVLWVLQWI